MHVYKYCGGSLTIVSIVLGWIGFALCVANALVCVVPDTLTLISIVLRLDKR